MTPNNCKLYRNTYRIASNRLRGWNYAANGHYFITIVTHQRNHYFGEVVDGQMVLNEIGQIVYDELLRSFAIREELFLGEFIVMPNHLHAIVTINNPKGNNAEPQQPQFQRQPKSISSFVAGFKSSCVNKIDDWIDNYNREIDATPAIIEPDGNVIAIVETDGRPSLQSQSQSQPQLQTQPRPRLKIEKFNKNNPLWQANYHDHIIRNEREYYRVAEYIVNNPLKWNDDTLSRIETNKQRGQSV